MTPIRSPSVVFALALTALPLPPATPPTQATAPISPPAAAVAPRVRLFLLAGQSNMQGQAVADLDDPRDYNGGKGTLRHLLADGERGRRWRHLVAADGSFSVRDDVFVVYRTDEELKAGPLSVGFGPYRGNHHFGPELALGHVLGERFAEPVVLVKTCWGGKSLAHDFLPPSADGPTGAYYTRMLDEFRAAVAALPATFPALAGHSAELEGVVWFQGWNDGCDDAAAAAYEENLVALIRDLRAEFGRPRLPFVVGETGNMDHAVLRAGQRKACERPELGGGVRFVPTADFRRPAEQSPNTTHGHHWFGNAESYLLIGEGLGQALADLVGGGG